MDRNETRDATWDREQVAPDTEVPLEGEHTETWNRHQWASDNPGTSGDTIGVANETLPGETASLNDLDQGTADMDAISGRGKPSGESHFERNDPTE